MQAFEDEFGVQIRQLWGMTETSPVATVAWPPPGVVGGGALGAAGHPGPADVRRRGAHRRRRRCTRCPTTARPSASSRSADRGSPASTTATSDDREVRRRLAAHRRRGPHRPAGYVTLTDRAKDVIKSGGEWISSVDLENHLIAHPAVLEAAVVGVPDERWQERPLAAVVLEDGADGHVPPSCGSSWPTRSFAGGYPSAGRSSTRCRGPASASTTRRPSGPGTPTASTRWSPSPATRRKRPRRGPLQGLLRLLAEKCVRREVSVRRAGRPSRRRRRRDRCCAAARR